jgi:hypothetical protein
VSVCAPSRTVKQNTARIIASVLICTSFRVARGRQLSGPGALGPQVWSVSRILSTGGSIGERNFRFLGTVHWRYHLYIYPSSEVSMADRKQFQNVTAPDPELMRLLDESRNVVLTEQEMQEQRISFAFGNAPDSDLITKDSVRFASEHIKLLG